MNRPGLVPVQKLATCKRCGDSQVAWYQTKTGKWMLCAALIQDSSKGQFVAQIFQPHKCTPEGAR